MAAKRFDRTQTVLLAVALALAAVRVGVVLFVPPVVGLANNGDFERVMARVGLGYLTDRYDERYWSWALTKFSVHDESPFHTQHLTTEVPVAGVAVLASRLLVRSPVFDIRFLGAVHAILFLGALGLLIRAGRDLEFAAQWLAAAMLVFFFTDVGYTAPFQSLYTQTSSFLALLWLAAIVGSVVRLGRAPLGLLLAYFAAAAWFVGSKPQECLQAPLLALVGWKLGTLATRGRKRLLLTAALGLSLCVFAAWFYRRVPRFEIHDVGVYHTVFMDLLPNSPDPTGDLRALGLDPAFIRFSGRHAYLPGSPLSDPAFRAGFFDRFGYRQLIGFYLARPARLWDRFARAGRLAFRLRPSGLGNLDQASGAPSLYHYQHASTWSRWRLSLGHGGLYWIGAILVGNLVQALIGRGRLSPRERLFRDAVAVLALMAGLEFAVCNLADYLDDLPRHLFAFQAMIDLLLVIDAGWCAHSILARRSRSYEAAASPRVRAAS